MKRKEFLKLSLAIGAVTTASALGMSELVKSELEYRYVYVLEQPYYNLNGEYISSGGLYTNDKSGKILRAKDFISTKERPFQWNGVPFDPDLDLVLENYKGIADCVAYG